MQLTVPHRTQPNANSFPTQPEGVSQWLKKLRPLDSEADAQEIYRGLKHSNRLHNDVDKRREVLNSFVPILRELHSQLSEVSISQPLPLTREFSKSSRLADALLREEAFAFKLLLSDNPTPLADDARRAMQALARQTEAAAYGFRAIPGGLIQDAHQLYALAEEHKLLSNRQGSELLSLLDHYRFILLSSVADLAQHRVRQLPLVIDFLKICVPDIHIEKDRDTASLGSHDYAIQLKTGSLPEPALSLLSTDTTHVRWFSIAPVLYKIDHYSSRLRSNASTVLGSDTLEKQSLARIHVALGQSRCRRSARRITSLSRRVIFGHKEICAHLLYRPAQPPRNESPDWTVTNLSVQGLCLNNPVCRPGLVQAGELISITEPNKPLRASNSEESSKIDALVGMVRWVHAYGDQGVTLGVELLAKSALPVRVLRNSQDIPQVNQHNQPLAIQQNDVVDDAGIGENALIVACKIQQNILQTILVPAYLFESGDKLTAVQGGRSRKIQLRKCIQANGLFSQYSLVDASDTNS